MLMYLSLIREAEGEVNQTINLTLGEVGLFNGITQVP